VRAYFEDEAAVLAYFEDEAAVPGAIGFIQTAGELLASAREPAGDSRGAPSEVRVRTASVGQHFARFV